MLAAASSVRLDAGLLQQQVRDVVDAVPPSGRGYFGGPPGEWTSIPLVIMPRPASGAGGERPGQPTPLLSRLPLLVSLMERLGGLPHTAFILRQPPRSLLPWHFDNQALHLPLCRLLITVQAPAPAFTWIGHERVAFPDGTLWAGDFALPHQVENPADQERLMIGLDYAPTESIRALFPPALWADALTRQQLSNDSINLLRADRL